MRTRLWIGAALAASTLLAGSPAQAYFGNCPDAGSDSGSDSGFDSDFDSGDIVAYWSMDENGRTFYDHGGHNHDGRVGRDVRTGVRVDGARAYRFGRLDPDTPPTHPEHLVVVSDRAALDPGDRDFAITVRLRAHEQFGNIVQKGQATVPGGSYKLQFPRGKVQCWFRGSEGQVLVTSPRAINDERWHTVTCTRTQEGVFLDIDGSTVAGRRGPTGRIANSWPLSIGGKTSCDQIHVGCDYFAGDIDYLRIYAHDS